MSCTAAVLLLDASVAIVIIMFDNDTSVTEVNMSPIVSVAQTCAKLRISLHSRVCCGFCSSTLVCHSVFARFLSRSVSKQRHYSHQVINRYRYETVISFGVNWCRYINSHIVQRRTACKQKTLTGTYIHTPQRYHFQWHLVTSNLDFIVMIHAAQ